MYSQHGSKIPVHSLIDYVLVMQVRSVLIASHTQDMVLFKILDTR